MGEFDSLEAELASFSPRPVSPQLSACVADRLTADARRRTIFDRAVVGGLGLAAAASVVLGVTLWRHGTDAVRPGGGVVIAPPPVPTTNVASLSPPGLAYERSAAHAPEKVDALLDRQAARMPRPNRTASVGAVEAFTRDPKDVSKLTGEPP